MSGASRVPSRVRGAVEGCFASVSPLAFSLRERAGLWQKRSGLSTAPAAGVFFPERFQKPGVRRDVSRVQQPCGPRSPATLPKLPLCREHWRENIPRDFCSSAWLGLGAFGLQGAWGRNMTKWQKMRFHLFFAFRLRESSCLVQPGFCCPLFCVV